MDFMNELGFGPQIIPLAGLTWALVAAIRKTPVETGGKKAGAAMALVIGMLVTVVHGITQSNPIVDFQLMSTVWDGVGTGIAAAGSRALIKGGLGK